MRGESIYDFEELRLFAAVFIESLKRDGDFEKAGEAAKKALSLMRASLVPKYPDAKSVTITKHNKRQIIQGVLYEVHFRDYPPEEKGIKLYVMASTMMEALEKSKQAYPDRDVTWLMAIKETFGTERPEDVKIIL